MSTYRVIGVVGNECREWVGRGVRGNEKRTGPNKLPWRESERGRSGCGGWAEGRERRDGV